MSEDLNEFAKQIQLLVMAQRRMRVIGDAEGVALLTRYFQAIDKIDNRLVKNAERGLVGCGLSFSKDVLEQIKESVREELEAIK